MATTRKKGKSVFRKVNDWLHLWLGLSSGIVVVIVSLTGCIYAFQKEISSLTQSYHHVKAENKPFLQPSQLKAIAAKAAFGPGGDTGVNRITGITLRSPKESTIAAYMHKEDGYTTIFLNPYTGEVLKHKALKSDFFRFILEGHFNLWLPRKIGQPLVSSFVLVFIVLLISGLIMWWPKRWNKANRKKSLTVKLDASKKRLNYDLHNVLGFYAMIIALVLAVTGVVFGFQWFAKSYYWSLTGGKTLVKLERAKSDTTIAKNTALVNAEDILYAQIRKEHPGTEGAITINFPHLKSDTYYVIYNPDNDVFYRRELRFFDQNTLKELKGRGAYTKQFASLSPGEKIYRMNYDIHVGAIAGLPGKILMFFISLICASLPITGFCIWWGRRNKKSLKREVPVTRKKIAAKVAASL